AVARTKDVAADSASETTAQAGTTSGAVAATLSAAGPVGAARSERACGGRRRRVDRAWQPLCRRRKTDGGNRQWSDWLGDDWRGLERNRSRLSGRHTGPVDTGQPQLLRRFRLPVSAPAAPAAWSAFARPDETDHFVRPGRRQRLWRRR